MRHSRMAVPARASVTVNQLSGGLNLYDAPNRVADSQLTECHNMWWHQGALRTRPGLQTERTDARHFTIRQTVNQREQLLSRMRPYGDGVEFYASHLSAEAGLTDLGAEGYTYYGTAPDDDHDLTALGIRAQKNADTGWYYLLSGGDIIQENPKQSTTKAGKGWVDAAPYIPTVMVNGKGEEYVADTGGSAYEDFNMLTRAFICTYTTDGESRTWQLPLTNLGDNGVGDDPLRAKVEISLYSSTKGLRTVEVDLTKDKSIQSVDLTLEEAGLDSTEYTSCRLQVSYVPRTGRLTTQIFAVPNAQSSAEMGLSVGIPEVHDNNLKITAYRSDEYDEQRLTICRMTRGHWFGGDRSGTEGGTRLFVAGNPDKPNLLHWSGTEHPLYFPENNYTYIGNDEQALTAFGQQGNLLVLFKERETYALEYVAGDEEDVEFALSGGQAVTAYTDFFPVTPLSAAIGCDCPHTVRLVNNRLVWLNSDGQVYMLTGVSQYSERNVRCISRNVRSLMQAHGPKAMTKAQAAEYNGYYLLLIGQRIYLLDTQTSAFSSFNYYDDENSARKALPWFVWALPEAYTYTGMVGDGTTVRLTATVVDNKPRERVLLLTGDTDDGEVIPCRFATRLWDFNRPDTKKSVEELYAGIGCQQEGTIRITYITEKGEYPDPYILTDRRDGPTVNQRYLQRMRLAPGVRLVQVFGIRVECDRTMEVDGLHIKARQQGVVR